ncbi:hypothetical protein MLD38_031803 [Melastoma candidum]|uniref:Uncharacterized protein n=1 Tax=Melastoma candidum TaxID=119954 RepID=A0ACB9MVG0_9MYRT|nr:hypothetical protein MLD38_031803 [Melastoma candidum]
MSLHGLGETKQKMGGVRVYWRRSRRSYQKLKPETGRVAVTRVGCRRPRLSWSRLDLLKLARLMSPKKWLVRLRDAYVDMMIRWSSSRACPAGVIVDVGASAFGEARLKEYDRKVVKELHKLIVLAESQGKAVMVEPVVQIPSRSIPEEIEV